MKPAKWRLVLVAVGLCLTAGTVLAADKAQTLKQASDKLEAVLNENEIRERVANVGVFKKAGLSYQASLVAPVEGVVGCKQNEQLRMLLGTYTFDANYALLFGKKQPFAVSYGQVNDIADRLNLRGRLRFRYFTPAELTKVLDYPDDPANRDLYVKYVAANIHDMLTASRNGQALLDLFLDFGYGGVIEGLYVAGKLALAAGTGPKLVALFNEQAARLEDVNHAFVAFAENPELVALPAHSQHGRVLKSVLEILKSRRGNLAQADVVKILSLIEPDHSKLVSKCN